jgi:predicted XRE-type DNA-binding protein
MSTDFDNPETWLEAVRREGLKPAPERHEHLADRASELRREQRLVTSLTELRRATALTQTDVAHNWGRSQSRVSSIEAADIATIEIGTLVDYARALNGHVEIRVTVATGGERAPKTPNVLLVCGR